MKKSLKILALVLTLALVCGAFVVSAFAADPAAGAEGQTAVTGETYHSGADWENIDKGSYGIATVVTDPAAAGHDKFYQNPYRNAKIGLFYAGRMGEASILAAEYEDNQYFHFAVPSGSVVKSASGPYISFGEHGTLSTYRLADQNFSVIDFDVMAPSGNFLKDWGPAFYVKAMDANGTVQWGPQNTFGFNSRNNAVMENASSSLGWGPTTAIPTDSWTHLTFILEARVITTDSEGNKVAADAAGAIECYEFWCYLAVNGEVVSARTVGNSFTVTAYTGCAASRTPEGYLDGDMLNAYISAVRFGLSNDEAGTTDLAMDNFVWRSYSATDYEGNLADVLSYGIGADLTTWSENLYSPDMMPFGKLVATMTDENGEVVGYYDNLQEAVDASDYGYTITLNADASGEVTVNSYVDIQTNGFTCDVTGSDTFVVYPYEDGSGYYSEEATQFLTVVWNGNGYFEDVEVQVPLNNNIYDSYEQAMGVAPTVNYVDTETQILYALEGWTDASGNIAEFTEDLVVTEDLLDLSIELVPVVGQYTPNAKIVKEDGSEVNYWANTAFEDVFLAAPANSTVMLLADITGSNMVSLKTNNVTLDLNGYDYVNIRNDGSKYSAGIITLAASRLTFTLTSSKVGGTVYSSAYTSKWAGDPFIATGAYSVVNVKGNDDEGNTTLTVYCATAVQNYGSDYVEVYIDGGEYYRTASDNWGLFQFFRLYKGEIKNAFLWGSDTICNSGRQSYAGTLAIDNCYIEAPNNTYISQYGSATMTVTVTNTYINANNKPTGLLGGATQADGSEWTYGKGCYIAAGKTLTGATYDGSLSDVAETLEVTYVKNDFAAADPTALTTTTAEVTFTKYVGPNPISIELVDEAGNSIATVEAVPGQKATTPATAVEGTDGWVMEAKSVLVPEDAVAGDKVTVPADADTVYAAGKISGIMFNYDTINHFQYNWFVPVSANADIEIVSADFWNGANIPATSTITDYNGQDYKVFARWPLSANAAEDKEIIINYTYKGTALAYTVPAVSAVRYASYVFANTEHYNDELEVQLAYMLEYVNACTVKAGMTPSAALTQLIADTASYRIYETPDFSTAAAIDTTAIDEYVASITMTYANGVDGLAFKITLNGDYFAQGYRAYIESKGSADWIGAWVNTSQQVIWTHNTRIRAWNDDLYVVVLDGSGAEVARCDYSFGGYVTAAGLTGDDLAFAQTVYNYSLAADAQYDAYMAMRAADQKANS